MAEYVTAVRTADGDKQIDYNYLANKDHAAQHKTGASDAIKPSDIGAARESLLIDTASIGVNWTGDSVPYSQTFTVNGVTAKNIIEISLKPGVDADTIAAYQALMLQDGGQTANQFTLLAYGTKNLIAIPINIVIRRDL